MVGNGDFLGAQHCLFVAQAKLFAVFASLTSLHLARMALMPPCDTMNKPAFSNGFIVDVLVMSNVPSAFCSTTKLFLLVKYIFRIFIPLSRYAVGLNGY